MLISSLLVSVALACPTIAQGTPEPLQFDTAQVAMARQGERVTFTVSINPQGTPQDFSLVMPVPSVLREEDFAVLDAAIFDRLGGMTGVLTMPDAGCGGGGGVADTGAAPEEDGGGGGGSGSVVVEAEYLVGDYAITILSAEESTGLFLWLEAHGYQVDPILIPALQEYIDQGMYFMAAQVSEGARAADGSALPPLQLSWNSAVWSIPIKLAALSSPGEQDMIMYLLTDQDVQGNQVGISNYPEVNIADQCIWGEQGVDDFAAFYDTRFRPAWEEAGRAAWALEWSGGMYDCSPCSGISLTNDDYSALGYDGSPEGAYLTRIHLRYTPETADTDLILYGSGIYEPSTVSFADANHANASCIEACPDSPGEAWMEANGYAGGEDGSSDGADGAGGGDGAEGGTDGIADEHDDHDANDAGHETDQKGTGHCSSTERGPLPWLGGLIGFGLLLRRRR